VGNNASRKRNSKVEQELNYFDYGSKHYFE